MRKIILFVIDGGSFRVVDYLLKKEKLPCFNALTKNGINEPLCGKVNVDPWIIYDTYREHVKKIPRLGIHSRVFSWTSLATGLEANKHNLVSDTERDCHGIERPLSRKGRAKPAIWEIIASKNKKIGNIGWIANWPPAPLPYYTVVRISDIFGQYTVSPDAPLHNNAYFYKGKYSSSPTYPTWLWKELSKISYDQKIKSLVQKISSDFSSVIQQIKHDSLYLEWAKYLLKRFPQPDFLTICIHQIHNLSHFYWDCLEMEKRNFKGAIHSERQKKVGHIIEDYYQYVDEKISQIVSLVEKDSIIMIVSPYGMRNSRITKKSVLMDNIYQELGFLNYSNGKIDWQKTKAYDNQNPWGIFAIRKGFIKGKYRLKTFNNLKRRLEKIKTERGESLFVKTAFDRKDNSFTVTPNYKAIHYSTKIRLNNKYFPAKKFVRFLPHYSLHDPSDGFLIISGRGIPRRKPTAKVSIFDIAPTILGISGIKYKDNDMPGKPILKF